MKLVVVRMRGSTVRAIVETCGSELKSAEITKKVCECVNERNSAPGGYGDFMLVGLKIGKVAQVDSIQSSDIVNLNC